MIRRHCCELASWNLGKIHRDSWADEDIVDPPDGRPGGECTAAAISKRVASGSPGVPPIARKLRVHDVGERPSGLLLQGRRVQIANQNPPRRSRRRELPEEF